MYQTGVLSIPYLNSNYSNLVWHLAYLQEREAAAKMFKGKKGKQFAAEIGKRTKTFVPGAPLGAAAKPAAAATASADVNASQAAAQAARQQDMAAIKVSSL